MERLQRLAGAHRQRRQTGLERAAAAAAQLVEPPHQARRQARLQPLAHRRPQAVGDRAPAEPEAEQGAPQRHHHGCLDRLVEVHQRDPPVGVDQDVLGAQVVMADADPSQAPDDRQQPGQGQGQARPGRPEAIQRHALEPRHDQELKAAALDQTKDLGHAAEAVGALEQGELAAQARAARGRVAPADRALDLDEPGRGGGEAAPGIDRAPPLPGVGTDLQGGEQAGERRLGGQLGGFPGSCRHGRPATGSGLLESIAGGQGRSPLIGLAQHAAMV